MNSVLAPVLNFDHYVNHWATAIRTPFLNKLMYWATFTGRFEPMLILSIILFFILVLMKKKDMIVPFLVAMPGGYGVMSLIKYLFSRARPSNAVFHVNSFSFPSGHAMMSTIFFLFILIVFYNDIKKLVLRILFLVIVIGTPLLISFSRIYFNVHWASDVIGGIILGMIWLSLSFEVK